MRFKSAAAAAFACLSLGAFGAVAPQLPPSEYLDSEVSTNVVLEQGRQVGELELRLVFTGTPSNNVEVVVGTDADGDGELSFDESGVRLGWDCGRYFVERVATGERFDAAAVGTNDVGRALDWRCVIRRGRILSLVAAPEAGDAILSVTTNAPAWLYDAGWNLMRLTARGVDVQDERFSCAVTPRGHLVILR